ncbi:MAG: hypothetical protein E6606_08055, partial [Streptococcus mitis]|nr:hypothetical protein [Streptococcus mitis]
GRKRILPSQVEWLMLKSIYHISSHTQWKSKSKLGSKPQVAQNTVLRLWIELTKSVTIYTVT